MPAMGEGLPKMILYHTRSATLGPYQCYTSARVPHMFSHVLCWGNSLTIITCIIVVCVGLQLSCVPPIFYPFWAYTKIRLIKLEHCHYWTLLFILVCATLVPCMCTTCSLVGAVCALCVRHVCVVCAVLCVVHACAVSRPEIDAKSSGTFILLLKMWKLSWHSSWLRQNRQLRTPHQQSIHCKCKRQQMG